MPEKRFHKNLDYIIVGQGIAGTILSYSLLKKGKKILVIDDNPKFSSSKVAGGIMNYVTGRRFVKTWLADTIIPFANETYAEMEAFLNKQFYYPLSIYKPLFYEKEKTEFEKIIENKTTQTKLSLVESNKNTFLKPHRSAIVIHNTGYLNVQIFLEVWRNYFLAQNHLLEKPFDYSSLIITKNDLQYEEFNAKKIIFCEGFQITNNPFFNTLPSTYTHGDILTIEVLENESFEYIVSKGIYIIPFGNRIYKVGATYSWDIDNPAPTESGKKELIEKLEKLLAVPYRIIAHEAGVRPTVKDRRPLIGLHPQHQQIGLFNGLGTKGVSLAPYFANHFVDHLENNVALIKEVNINRFSRAQ